MLRHVDRPGRYLLQRTQATGERRGFHPVCVFDLVRLGDGSASLRIARRYTNVRGIPGAPFEFWFKAGSSA